MRSSLTVRQFYPIIPNFYNVSVFGALLNKNTSLSMHGINTQISSQGQRNKGYIFRSPNVKSPSFKKLVMPVSLIVLANFLYHPYAFPHVPYLVLAIVSLHQRQAVCQYPLPSSLIIFHFPGMPYMGGL